MSAEERFSVTVLDMQPIEPAVGGGRLRLLGLYHALGDDFATSYVGTYDWPGPGFRRQMLSSTLEEILVPLSAEHFAQANALSARAGGRVVIDSTFPELSSLSPDYVSAARKAAASADIVVFSHPWIYPQVRDLLDPARQLVVYDAHNVESLLRMELLDDGGAGTQIVREVIRVEMELCHSADLVLTCSRQDRDAFNRLYGISQERMRVIPNGTFTNKVKPATPEEKPSARAALELDNSPVAIFIGSDYEPNAEAAFFIANRIAHALPQVLFVVAGGVGERLSGWPRPFNLRVPGIVYEEQKRLWLHASDIAINPMFGGSGTNIKMLDYMAAGLPIVTTPTGARGLDCAAEPFVLSEAPDFARTIRALLTDKDRMHRVSRTARLESEKQHSWEAISPRLGSLLKRWSPRNGRRPYFSVIIPATDDTDTASVCRSVDMQTIRNFEIVVSNVPSRAPASEHSNSAEIATARNLGAELARGAVLAFTEPGYAPEHHWLEEAYRSFTGANIAVAEGRILDSQHGTEIGNELFSPANLFVRSDVFQVLGGFRGDAADADFAWRAQVYGTVTGVDARIVPQSQTDESRQRTTPSLNSLGWISSWRVPCGIAEYSRNLLDALRSLYPSLHVMLYCDKRSRPAQSGGMTVKPCWTTSSTDGEPVVAAILNDPPEVLVIQHQHGLFPWQSLWRVLEHPQLQGLPRIVELHNTQELLDFHAEFRARVLAGLAHADHLLVHTVADFERLNELGHSGPVHVFPHGSHPVASTAPARTLDSRSAPLLGCFGFLFPHKGIYALIGAFAEIRQKWSGARLRLVNAVFPRTDSQTELSRCRRLASELGVIDAIEWDTEFLDESDTIALLSQTDLVVLPYETTAESASGALRIALASGAPVAVSPNPIFDEAETAVARLAGANPSDIAASIDRLLENRDLRAKLQTAAAQWVRCRTWTRMARQMAIHLALPDCASPLQARQTGPTARGTGTDRFLGASR